MVEICGGLVYLQRLIFISYELLKFDYLLYFYAIGMETFGTFSTFLLEMSFLTIFL